MNGNRRPELDDLLGAYALDAIEPVEHFEMDQYVRENADARREVDELRETAGLLALLHAEREPVPERVWEGIESAINEPAVAETATATADVVAIGGTRGDEGGRDTRPRTRPHPRRSVPLPVAALLVAAASVAIVLLVARHDTTGHSTASAYRAAAAHSQPVPIVGTAGTLAHVVRTPDGSGYLHVDHMPALPAGEVYQLWVIAPGRSAPISAGVLGRAPRAYKGFVFQGRVTAFALSVERAPGATTPSTPIGESSA